MPLIRKIIVLKFVCLLFLVNSTLAQQFPFQNFTVANGLVSDYVFDLMQDKNGFIWIATDKGVSCFDGSSFENFSKSNGLCANYIYTILQSSDSTMWFLSEKSGVTSYNSGGFKTYSVATGLPDNRVYDIEEDDLGRILFFTSKGVAICEDSKIIQIKKNIKTSGKVVKYSSDKFVFFWNNLLYSFSSKDNIFEAEKIELTPLKIKSLIDSSSESPIYLNDSTIVFQGIEKLFEINKKNNSVTIKGYSRTYYALLEDRFNRLWSAERNGVTVSDKEGKFQILKKNGLEHDYIEAFLEDREGNIWLGTFGGGISKYKGDYVKYFTKEEGLITNSTKNIFEDSKGRIIIGTSDGLSTIGEDSKITNFLNNINSNEIQAINENSNGGLYVGTFEKVFGPLYFQSNLKYSKNNTHRIHSGVSSIFIDIHDRAWISTYGHGLNFIENGVKYVYPKNNELPTQVIEKIVPGSDNSFWLLSKGFGAVKVFEDSLINFRKKDGLVSDAIYSLYEETDGTVWFGTDQGVSKLFNGKYTSFPKKNGIVGNYVIGIIKFNEQVLFITESTIHYLKNNEFKILTNSNILHNSDIAVNDYYFSTKNKTLWFATNKGVVKLNLPQIFEKNNWLKNKHPNILITSVNSDTTQLSESPTILSSVLENHISLPYWQNDIRFAFKGVSFVGDHKLKYSYKLNNNDNWSKPTAEKEVSYYKLASGKYMFSVHAINSKGVRSKTPAKFSFTILPPIWMSFWFLLPAFLLVVALLIFSFDKNSKYSFLRNPFLIPLVIVFYSLSIYFNILKDFATYSFLLFINWGVISLFFKYTLIVIGKFDGSNYIAGYKIIEIIGMGGMGKVFCAIDVNKKRKVALKILNPSIVKDAENKKRLTNEGKILASFNHSTIVKVYEIGETEEHTYLAMEYLSGGTLHEYIKEKKMLSENETLKLALQICDGLEIIHNGDCIHRDLKSQNIMFDSEGNIKIMDFGLSKAPLISAMTSLGTVIGTLGYVAPEQVTGTECDFRTDIFSLGVVMYEMTTGVLPFSGENEIAVIHSIFNIIPPFPSSKNIDISKVLDEVIMKMLKKEADERFQTVAEIKQTIMKLI